MTYTKAEAIYRKIVISKFDDLRNDFLQLAMRYAKIRSEWAFLSREIRREKENLRTQTHNALISACNALSRNMGKAGEDNSWRMELGDDRKKIGDFACYLHCIIGIEMR